MGNKTWLLLRELDILHVINLIILTVALQLRFSIMFDPYSYTGLAETLRRFAIRSFNEEYLDSLSNLYKYIDLNARFIEYQYDVILFLGLGIGAIYSLSVTRWLVNEYVKIDIMLPFRRESVILIKFISILTPTILLTITLYIFNVLIRYGGLDTYMLYPVSIFILHVYLISSIALFISVMFRNELLTFFLPVVTHWFITDIVVNTLFGETHIKNFNFLSAIVLTGRYADMRRLIDVIIGIDNFTILPLPETGEAMASILYISIFLSIVGTIFLLIATYMFSRGEYD